MGILLSHYETSWLDVPNLFATTFYLPSRVVRQFGLVQDVLEDALIGLLRESMLHPSTLTDFTTAMH